MTVTPHMLPQSFFPACGCTLRTEDGERVYICPTHQRQPWGGEAQSAASVAAEDLPSKQESSSPLINDSRIAEIDDLPWARERVANMCANALINSKRFGVKLLKGFGYPNEIFSDAQDYRALAILLSALEASEARLKAAEQLSDRYAIAARVIGLYLEQFCDKMRPYDEMIADASRKAKAHIEALAAENASLRAQLDARKTQTDGLPVSHSDGSTNQPPELGGQ